MKFEDTYASNSKPGDLPHTTTFQWNHSLSQVINALVEAGLAIMELQEHFHGYFKRFPRMYMDDDGLWKHPDNAIPLSFTLVARG